MAKKRQDIENNAVEGETDPPSAEIDFFNTPVRGQNFFGFQVGELGFMVPIDFFCELLDKYQVNRLPNVQPWFHGLINLRGNLVPVFDLKMVLNKDAVDNKKRHLFVIGRGEKAVALWIDTYPEILALADMRPQKSPPELPPFLQRLLSRSFTLGGKTWLECDLDGLFTALGKRHIAVEEGAHA